MLSRLRRTWRAKLADDKNLPRLITLSGPAVRRWGGRTMVIAAPREVDALMRMVPRGRVTTINELRAALAEKHRVETACPITTGIFSWMAAHAAAESAAAGEKNITPYWRTLRQDGELNPKYPGGIAGVRRQLAAEGHGFVAKGKRTLVRDYEAALFKPAP